MAAVMMPKLSIVLDQEPFVWNVALIEPVLEATSGSGASAALAQPQASPATIQPARPVEAAMTRVAPQQSPQIVHPVVPVIEPPKPQPAIPPAPPVQDIVQEPVKPDEPQEVKKAEIKEPEPPMKDVVKQETVKEPARETAPIIEPAAPTYSYQAPVQAATEAVTESHRESIAVAGAPSAAKSAPADAASSSVASLPRVSEEPPASVSAPPAPAASSSDAPTQIAKAAPQSIPQPLAAKADHRWVGESLWRRVAELKRYPSSARLNGLEGRVVLKAIIRADGQLAEVSVVKSSGHAVLDAAAMEAVKLACPLHMKHPIGPPQIVVSLPIVYSLANQ